MCLINHVIDCEHSCKWDWDTVPYISSITSTRTQNTQNNAWTPGLFVGIFHPLVCGGQLADCPFIVGYMCLINNAKDFEHSCKMDWDRVPYIMVYFLTRTHIVENNARTTYIFVGIFLSLVFGGQLADCQFLGGYMCLINHAIDCEHSCKRDWDRVPYIIVYFFNENSYYKK